MLFTLHCYNIGILRVLNMHVVPARPSEAALFRLNKSFLSRHAKCEARLLINTDPSRKRIIYLVMYTHKYYKFALSRDARVA